MSTGSAPPAGVFGSSGISGFGYGVGVSIGILLIVSTIAFAVYFCVRTSYTPAPAAAIAAGTFPAPAPPRRDDVEAGGIDEATLEAYPAVIYREARKQRQAAEEEAACCAVCLERYGDSDVVRVLPDCGHLFHRECVYPWLRQRPTCPVCRTSPLPSPMPTPLAEVTPLALARPS
uniref:Uncharacterized protein n=1 Tax=Avena sativa TaxID=4498 RepID=A0ACD5UMT9_AVESA